MTARTTAEELLVSKAMRADYVFLIEGIPVAFTNSVDLTGVSGAWGSTDWNASAVDWYRTAQLPGSWSQQVDLFNPKIRAGSITFEVLDKKRYLAGLIFGPASAVGSTFLEQNLDNDDTAIVVKETAAFPAVGTYNLYIGNETFEVDGTDKTDTGWSTSIRARWALGQTESDASFASGHRVNVANKAKPRVTDRPTTWFNRRVAIYMHHYEAGSRNWSTADQALLVWSGYIKSITDSGQSSIIFNAVDCISALQRDILQNQFTADVDEGIYIPEGRNRITFYESIAGSTPTTYSTTFTPGWYSAGRMNSLINQAIGAATLDYVWSLGRRQDNAMAFEVMSDVGDVAPADYKNSLFAIAFDWDVWDLLGFISTGGHGFFTEEGGVTYEQAFLNFSYERGSPGIGSGQVFYGRVAEQMPLKYRFNQSNADGDPTFSIRLTNVQGEFVTQSVLTTNDPNPFGVAGYLKFGTTEIIGGTFDGVTGLFRVTQRVRQQFDLDYDGKAGAIVSGSIRETTESNTMSCVQVWFEEAPVSDIFLRILLSTGTAGYNSATYDVNPASMGVGLPYSLVNVDSFKALGSSVWTLYLAKAEDLARHFESMLATYGRYLVWKSGQITLVHLSLDGPGIATSYVLDDANLARRDERLVIDHGQDGIVNAVEIKYDRTADGQFKTTLHLEDAVSESDFGKQRVISIEAWGVQNRAGRGIPEVVRNIGAMILAFFSRPVTAVERSYTRAMTTMAPGDTVLLTSAYLIDPRTGEQGMVNFPVFVLSTRFNPATQNGTVRLCYSGEFDVDKICQWAWSARVNDGATDGGYTETMGDRYVEVRPSVYRGTGQAADDTGVAVGDKIRIRELSPRDPFNPLSWSATVASIDLVNHRIHLDADLVGWDTGRYYIVTPDIITTVINSQRVNTFIADDADDSTGFLANDHYIYGMPKFLAPVNSPEMTQPFVRPPRDGSVDGKGYPLAIGDLTEAAKSTNVLLAYKTRHLVWSQVWTHSAGDVVSGDKEVVAGPIWVPLYGRGIRNLLIRLYGMTSDAMTPAVFTITTSRDMPHGEAMVANFPDASFPQDVDVQTSSTTLEWMDEVEVECSPQLGPALLGVWLTIECETGDALVTGSLRGVSIFEKAGT